MLVHAVMGLVVRLPTWDGVKLEPLYEPLVRYLLAFLLAFALHLLFAYLAVE